MRDTDHHAAAECPHHNIAATCVRCLRERVKRLDEVEAELQLAAMERSSAAEAANVLLSALGWSAGGLASAALQIVAERNSALQRRDEWEALAGLVEQAKLALEAALSVAEAAILRSRQGWCNAIELGLLRSCHHDEARAIIAELTAALAAMGSKETLG